MNRLASTLSVLVLTALASAPALADTYTYTYTGNDFAQFITSPGTSNPYTTTDFVSGSFTVSSPPAPNLSWTGQSIPIISETLSDGFQTLSTADGALGGVFVATDSAGNITSWLAELINPTTGNQIYTDDQPGIVGDGGCADAGGNDCAYNAYATADPGTWTLTDDGSPAATPEPSSLLLLGTGLFGAAGILRRRFIR